MGRTRRWGRRTCLVASALCLVLALVAPGSGAQEADDGPRPEVFRGVASSLAASVEADRAALLPIPEVFRFIALDGSGTFGSSNQEGRASILFPGNGLILGPGLACGTFGREFPDDFKPIFDTCTQYEYPLTVYADAFEPEGSTTGALALGSKSDPLSAHAGGAHAVANEHGVITDAAIQDLRMLGLPVFGPVKPPIEGFEFDGSVLTIDSAVSRTHQRLVKGALVVDAEATISGVRMIGGLIRIGSIRSLSHVTDDGAGNQTTEMVFEVSGVTVAGQPAQITDKGLVLDSSGGGSGPLAQQGQSQANELLKAYDVRVTVLEAEEGVDDRSGAAFARVGGVLIEFERDLQGLPLAPGPVGDIDPNGVYTGTIQLGNTAALGVVPVIPEAAPVDDIVDDIAGGDVGLPAEPVADPGVDAGGIDTGSVDAPAADPVEAPGSGSEEAASAPQEQVVAFVDELFSDRLRLLYLAFTLAALALCIAPRLTLPARLPGMRS